VKSVKHNGLLFATAAVLLSLGSCCLVDEDLSDCGAEFHIDYELKLVTNISTELKSVLSLESDIQIANALRDYLAPVFTDFAHDVDLSFYDVSEPYNRLEHMSEIMDANQTSYTIYLPSREYSHTAAANLRDNTNVSLEDSDYLHTSVLRQYAGENDIVSPHRTGLFTARLHIDVKEGQDQHFDVTLYMANAATALVLDTAEAPAIQDIKVFAEGFATEFHVADSTYVFASNPLILTEEVPLTDDNERCFAAVHFPSRDTRPEGTKVVIDTEDPFVAEDAVEALWDWRVYVTNEDGTVTETVMGITKPIRAGGLKILKAKVYNTGIVATEDPTVGVSVTLDWQNGMNHDVSL
jgi:hypothetical protein